MKERNFFEEVKYFNQQQPTLSTNSKDCYIYLKYYKIIPQKLQVSKKWNAYFYNILNQTTYYVHLCLQPTALVTIMM